MKRTQIYLTTEEAQGVARIAVATRRKQSEIIREAIDVYLQRFGSQDNLERLRAGRGIWRNRKELDLEEIRKDFDRF
jgi:predicted DNA-binding protein